MMGGVGELINGIFVLGLALVAWRITHSFIGWAVLFLVGSGLVAAGFVKIIYDRMRRRD